MSYCPKQGPNVLLYTLEWQAPRSGPAQQPREAWPADGHRPDRPWRASARASRASLVAGGAAAKQQRPGAGSQAVALSARSSRPEWNDCTVIEAPPRHRVRETDSAPPPLAQRPRPAAKAQPRPARSKAARLRAYGGLCKRDASPPAQRLNCRTAEVCLACRVSLI
jgi:hypothetical protein